MGERDESVMKIVDEALEMDPARRAQYIRTICGSDTTLLDQVEQLIKHDREARRAPELARAHR